MSLISRRTFSTKIDFKDPIQTAKFLLGLSLQLDDIIQALNSPMSGTTAQRPKPNSSQAGLPYFDTTLGFTIWWSGAAWVKHDGTAA